MLIDLRWKAPAKFRMPVCHLFSNITQHVSKVRLAICDLPPFGTWLVELINSIMNSSEQRAYAWGGLKQRQPRF